MHSLRCNNDASSSSRRSYARSRAFALALMVGSSLVCSASSYECARPDLAQELNVGKFFDTIDISGSCSEHHDSFMTPKTVHWHIYAIADMNETAKISMYPDNLVDAYVRGDSLTFEFVKDTLKDYGKGESIETSVNLFVPVSQLKSIRSSGVDQNIAVQPIDDEVSVLWESLEVKDSGVDNRMYVNTPNTRVHYRGSGVDTKLEVESASGSSIDISGVDQDVRIKTTGDELTVKMSGVDQTVTLQGNHDKIRMTGVDTTVYINSDMGCSNIDKDGVDNKCKTTDATVTVDTLSCLASTKIGHYGCDWWEEYKGAIIGGGVGFLVLLCLCCVGCAVAIKFCCCGRDDDDKIPPQVKTGYNGSSSHPPASQYYTQSGGQDPPLAEAEVLEVKPAMSERDQDEVNVPPPEAFQKKDDATAEEEEIDIEAGNEDSKISAKVF